MGSSSHTGNGGFLCTKAPSSPGSADAFHVEELVHIAYLADLLMSRFHTGLELERLNTNALATRLETIGLSISKFPELVDHIPLKVLESAPEFALRGS